MIALRSSQRLTAKSSVVYATSTRLKKRCAKEKGENPFTLDNLAGSNAAELLESTSLNLLDCQPSLRNKGLERSGL